jgi:putative protease
MELLAPAGSKEALVAAVQSGADAVYLGGKMYGARANAANFDMDQLAWALGYCRKYGVKVYVTVNTLIFEDEFEDLFAYVDKLVDLHVDALILQDVGLAVSLHKRYPDLPLHASTQMHIHNAAQVEWAKSIGFSRVVVARETPLDVVSEMVKTGMEIETFAHGALCVSYSGQCLMSSIIGGRSGNRGECAQPCRLPYTLVEERNGEMTDIQTEGDFLLSPKDLCTLKDIAKLKDAGVTGLKIEGRMKRPEYVAQVVSSYRRQLDHAMHKETLDTEVNAMAQIFSRGFTTGYLFGAAPMELLNMKTNSHVGLEIGEVTGCDSKFIHLKLKDYLTQGDGIRIVKGDLEEGFTVNFIYQNGLLVKMAKGIVELNRHMNIPPGAKVYKTTDVRQMEALNQRIDQSNRKVMVKMTLTFQVGEKAKLITEAHGLSVEMYSDELVQVAQKAPMDNDNLVRILDKVQDTIFEIEELIVYAEGNGFMPVSQLNLLRRKCLERLEHGLSNQYTPYIKRIETFSDSMASDAPRIIVTVRTLRQKQIAQKYNVRIFSENITLRDDTTGYIPPRANHDHHAFLNESMLLPYFTSDNAGESELFGDFGLNVANARSAKYFLDHGMMSVLASVELSTTQILQLAQGMKDHFGSCAGLEAMVYGKRELMVIRSCPLSAIYKTTPMQCSLCHQRRFYLKDRKGVHYRMEGDATCAMRIFEAQAMDRVDEMDRLMRQGIKHFRIVLDQESADQTDGILGKVMSKFR